MGSGYKLPLASSQKRRILSFIFSGLALFALFRFAWLIFYFLTGIFAIAAPILIFALVTNGLLRSLIFLIKTSKEYKNIGNLNIRSIETYLSSIENTNNEYCLILRPFGADGQLYLPIKINALIPGNPSLTIETVITKTVRDISGISTVSIVDPALKKIPPGPQYLKVDDDWKIHVEKLIERALFVIFLFPPGKHSTQSIEWELITTIEKDLFGRILLILPPPKQKNTYDTQNIVETISRFVPKFRTLPHYKIFACLLKEEPYYWYQKKKIGVLNEKPYIEIIRQAIQQILHNIGDTDFKDRYQYYYFDSNIFKKQNYQNKTIPRSYSINSDSKSIIVESIIKRYSSLIKDRHFYFAPNIPIKKLKNVLYVYAYTDKKENPLVLIDNTLWGSAKDGALLTNMRIYAYHIGRIPIIFDLSEIYSVTLVEKKMSNNLYINDIELLESILPEKDAMHCFTDMLKKISRIYHSQEFLSHP